MGKHKIDIRRIEETRKRLITFTKRRNGIFKKAAELCTLCNSEIAIITFSNAGKLYTFGHPSVESVIDRCYNGKPASNLHSDIINQLSKLECQLSSVHVKAKPFWWDRLTVEEYDHVDDLQRVEKALEELRRKALARANELSRLSAVPPLACIGFDDGAALPASDITSLSCMDYGASSAHHVGPSSYVPPLPCIGFDHGHPCHVQIPTCIGYNSFPADSETTPPDFPNQDCIEHDGCPAHPLGISSFDPLAITACDGHPLGISSFDPLAITACDEVSVSMPSNDGIFNDLSPISKPISKMTLDLKWAMPCHLPLITYPCFPNGRLLIHPIFTSPIATTYLGSQAYHHSPKLLIAQGRKVHVTPI